MNRATLFIFFHKLRFKKSGDATQKIDNSHTKVLQSIIIFYIIAVYELK